MNRSILAIGLLALGSPLIAQVPLEPKLGPFSTTGLAFVKSGSNELWHYRADLSASVPVQPAGTGGPRYDRASLFASLSPAAQGLVVVDAMSTGNDLVPVVVDGNGARIEQRNGGLSWSALFLSFRDETVSPTGAEPMATRKFRGGAGADLYSWITPGSSPLGMFEDEVFVDVPAEALGIPRNGEIEAIDIPMALMIQAGSASLPLFAPNPNEFYFSLTKASAAALASEFSGFPAADVSGATVFRTAWNGTAWGPITVAKTPASLGLAGDNAADPADDEELDALAVDAGPGLLVIFSVLMPSEKPQLMAVHNGNGPHELHDQDDNPVWTRTGDSDVDALCGIDPEMGHFSKWLGAPVSPAQEPLTLSLTQMYAAGSGQLVAVVDVNAVPQDGDLEQLVGSLVVQVSAWAPDQPPSWIDALTVPWNGGGKSRNVVPVYLQLYLDVQFRALYYPAGGGLQTSSLVMTRL